MIACATEGFILFRVPRLFSRKAKPPKAKIQKSANGHHDADAGAHKVGLKPKSGWRKRNFLTRILIPSLFRRRTDREETPEFPKLKRGEIGVTWIGHASFLLQFGTHNVLVDPNWARWLKVMKRNSRIAVPHYERLRRCSISYRQWSASGQARQSGAERRQTVSPWRRS